MRYSEGPGLPSRGRSLLGHGRAAAGLESRPIVPTGERRTQPAKRRQWAASGSEGSVGLGFERFGLGVPAPSPGRNRALAGRPPPRGGAPGATRTRNLLIRSQALYPLSYGGVAPIIARPALAGHAWPGNTRASA